MRLNMTPDEIAAIMERLRLNDEDHIAIKRTQEISNRLLYLTLGAVLGSGALTLSQVVGI